MTVKDVADLLFAARERIDFYWNFYVVVVIAVIGWLVSLKKTLTLTMKVLVSVAYLIAAAMNLLGLYSSYTFAEALRTDLLRMAATTPLTDTRFILEQHSYVTQQAKLKKKARMTSKMGPNPRVGGRCNSTPPNQPRYPTY